jgi:hypothetical protein
MFSVNISSKNVSHDFLHANNVYAKDTFFGMSLLKNSYMAILSLGSSTTNIGKHLKSNYSVIEFTRATNSRVLVFE